MKNYGITESTIATNSISSCHVILIDGEVKGTPFAYLSHYSNIYQKSHNEESALVDSIKNIREYQPKHNQ
jgi:hypothetical protein